MSDVAVARADLELQMVGALVDCAHALGLALGEAARAERDRAAQLALADAFNRSFLAVRMGIRLSLMLRAAPRTASPAATPRAEPLERERLEQERPDHEPPEHEPPESEGLERERDRDYEPVSLPRFLATLGMVAAKAERLKPCLPADVTAGALPTLRGLLARANPAPSAVTTAPSPRPATGADVLLRPPPAAPRSALMNSAVAPLALAAPLARPAPLTLPIGLARRPRPPPPAPGRT